MRQRLCCAVGSVRLGELRDRLLLRAQRRLQEIASGAGCRKRQEKGKGVTVVSSSDKNITERGLGLSWRSEL